MGLGASLRDHYLRLDARALAAFRVAIGGVLLADLAARWRHLAAFYSNEGVLPNHNHLFNLREKQEVWSVFHAFSSVGENRFAFVVTALVYVAFLVGFKTRAFHVLSLALFVSLTSRNILLEGVGNYATIALLALTVFLPVGSRFSIDSLKKSLAVRDEKKADDLNDRSAPVYPERILSRSPGWSPLSIAALAVLVQIAVIYACAALAQNGAAWKDGTALHYALHVDRWVTGAGAFAREAFPEAVLRSWTRVVWTVQVVIPVLIFLPFARNAARAIAAVLMVVHGLTFGLLLDFGSFGWTLCAAAALVIPTELWDAWRARRAAATHRARTVIYDEDCGICLWICRVLRRVDSAELLTFQGNADVSCLLRRKRPSSIYRAELPQAITPDVVASTVVAVDAEGRVFTRGRAVAEIVRALPGGGLVAAVLRAPGISSLVDVLYDRIAARREPISIAVGLDACGVPPPAFAAEVEGEAAGKATQVPGAVRLGRRVTGFVREAGALVVLVAMAAQTVRSNPVPAALQKIPQGKLLGAVASWPRMLARWDFLAPEPPREDGIMVIDAQTRGAKAVDVLTGKDPDLDMTKLRGTGLGQLWADYLLRIRDPAYNDFQKAFKDYLAKGGPRWEGKTGDEAVTGLDAYWITEPSPPPGSQERGAPKREKLFTHSRGGRSLGLDKLPTIRPGIRRPE